MEEDGSDQGLLADLVEVSGVGTVIPIPIADGIPGCHDGGGQASMGRCRPTRCPKNRK